MRPDGYAFYHRLHLHLLDNCPYGTSPAMTANNHLTVLTEQLSGRHRLWRILVAFQWPCQRHPRGAGHHDLFNPVVDHRLRSGLW